MTGLSSFEILLRDPALTARRALEGGAGASALARTALATLVFGAMLFGAVIGSYRGELQSLYAAIKMPMVLIGALVVTTPAVWALGASTGRAWTLRAVTSLVLAAAARAALVLVTVAPLLWVAIDLGAGYHFAALLATIAFSLGGLVALATLLRGIGADGLAVPACAVLVFVSGLAQTGWALRPWLGRPSQPVSFVRTEAGVGPLESVARSFDLGIGDPTGRDVEGSDP
jgi:hypothetical protein